MALTPKRYTSSDDFPTTQLFLLAICRVAEPIAVTSCIAYAFAMVRDFHIGDGNDASFYAGILVATFSLVEACTGMFWGALSDRIGRKPVLCTGLFGTITSLLLVGLAPNFWVALFGRALGGLLNGNIGVIQTMVGEIVKRPEHEPRAYAVMPFVWSIGTIIGPAVGGLLAKPAESYPSVFSHDGLFGKFPYLLPNLVCSILLLGSIIFAWLFLQETHPDMQPMDDLGPLDHVSVEHPLLVPAGATAHPDVDLRAESYGTFNQVQLHDDEAWTVYGDGSKPEMDSQKQTAFTPRVIMLIVALAIFTYHSMTYDHLLPIFLQDKRGVFSPDDSGLTFPGGIGLSTRMVGLIISSDGIIALIIQSLIFPVLAHYLGVWKLFIIVTVLHPLAYFMVPFLVFLPAGYLYPGIYACLVTRNILSIIDFPVLLILIKQACPSDSFLGKINGLAASAGAAARTIAPPVAGYLYSTGADMKFTALAWWGSAFVAIIGALQLWFISQKPHSSATIQPAARCHFAPGDGQDHKETIRILVTDVDEVGERA
ncbi:Putative Permease of the major facilitator superfamily [Aspergillus calidoustus]|uniref:Putative Permease of the major facilitator superfamily n=1 Tax=Aspergillus calidoustus TaxID=454130 RepID=A0A0U5G8A6_ASPCI|nr:Putative Permease of the major facilitator superfamily [Aspergillus calidoustus]